MAEEGSHSRTHSNRGGSHSQEVSVNADSEPGVRMQDLADMINAAMERNRLDTEAMINERFANFTSGSNHSTHAEELRKKEAELKKKQDEIDKLKKRSDGHRDKGKHISFDKFKKGGANPFDGTVEPVAAMQWIRDIEKVFRVSKCQDEDKVEYATSMLTKDALDWWSNIYDYLTEESREALTWEGFKEKFTSQYCPADLQSRYATEFLELKQGTMTVTAYVAEFIRKSKFAADILPTEARKVERFIQGLRLNIQEPLYGIKFATLEEAVSRARNREHMLEKIAAEASPPQEKVRFDNSSGHPFSPNHSRFSPGSHGSKARFCKRCRRNHFGSCRKQNKLSGHNNSDNRFSFSPINCFRCGETGHIAPNCTNKPVICFGCGAIGHVRANCPKSSLTAGPTVNAKPINSVAPTRNSTALTARPRAFQITAEEARQSTDVITGIFLTK